MSADAWSICPRCWKRAEAEFAKSEDFIAQQPEDVRRFMNIQEPDEEDYRFFREDYEIYIPGANTPGLEARNVVVVEYSGGCVGKDYDGGCGLQVQFTHEVPIEGVDD